METPNQAEPDDDFPEIGRITIIVRVGSATTGPTYQLQGLDHAAAMGYVLATLDSMRADQRLRWQRSPGPEGASMRLASAILALLAPEGPEPEGPDG